MRANRDAEPSVVSSEKGENDILFIGTPNVKTQSAYSSLNSILGASDPSPITKTDAYQPYFDYVLQYPVTIVDEADRSAILEKVDEEELAIFPSQNCCLWVDDTLVIRLQ